MGNRSLMLAMLVASVAACGGRSSGSGSTSNQTVDSAKPIPECVEYERAFARCNGVSPPIAAQPSLLPTTDADRERIKLLCAANLQRLNQACH